MEEKRKINVTIDGRSFTVVGTEDEGYIKSLADYVDQKIKNLANKNDKLSQTMAATLAALNIADELAKINGKLKELEGRSREPLEKFTGVTQELESSKDKIRELEKLCMEYKDEMIKSKLQVEEQYKQVNGLKEELELKELEIEELRNSNKALQDKDFQNQIEMVDIKKELAEIINSYSQNK